MKKVFIFCQLTMAPCLACLLTVSAAKAEYPEYRDTKKTAVADAPVMAMISIDELIHLLALPPAAAEKLLINKGYVKDPEKDKDGNDTYQGRTGTQVYLLRLHNTDIGYTTTQEDNYNSLFNSLKKLGLKPMRRPDGTTTFDYHHRYLVNFDVFKGALITTYEVWIFDPTKVKR